MHHIARIEKTDLGVGKLVKAATDIHSAASYIIEHLALNKGQICLFIQNSTFVVDNNDFKVVVGLPSKEVQMRPVTMMGVGLPNESWNRDLTLLIVDRTYYALQDATSTVGSYYYMSTRLHAIVTRTYPPISWHGTTPYEFLMELPVQSNLGDVGYVTATSPVFCQLFNAFDRDTTADYSARMVMTYSRNGFELDDMCAPIFNEGPPQEMYYIEADRQFMGTIQISPPVSGTTRRLLSLVYQSYACTDNINNANSIWTGCEPVGVKLYPLKVCGVAFVDTYWLDCSVTNSQESTPSATVDSEEVETQELKFDCIVEVDLITSFRQVQLVGLANANWSSKYHMSLTLLKTRGPRYAVLPMTT
ncbi:hypothetical protein FA95DRAFT_982810 [Auriscalpium vulgare]|uniref:Uncharacterized protein n=1 Tax=Auriscalpium vulgare TaxID=40419 RepID=A0ACB8R733_9AGAM|nr:hypothetical protein FA95DRAFT_982810 [Auriscalpium vulgare]